MGKVLVCDHQSAMMATDISIDSGVLIESIVPSYQQYEKY